MSQNRDALLILSPSRAAAFSATSATEGAHETLRAPTGAALLGWAAGRGRYDLFGEKARHIFHGGKVRFSNAVPLSPEGLPGWPTPQVLMKPKHGTSGWVKEQARETLDLGAVTVGRPGGDALQREFIGPGFITASGEKVSVTTSGRLRTALEMGSAKPGSLFSLSHIEPASALRYAASIEADAGVLDDKEWEQLLNAFRQTDIMLGRAATTAYGGYYAGLVIDAPPVKLWPAPAPSTLADEVTIWALSDLALVDADSGMPRLSPTASDFGLDADAALNLRRSAIAMRRYAPWNSALNGVGARDVERQVIAAGSVLVFTLAAPVEVEKLPSIVGIGREAGLGRIWITPSLLTGLHGEAPNLSGKPGAITHVALHPSAVETDAMKEVARDCIAWLIARPAIKRSR